MHVDDEMRPITLESSDIDLQCKVWHAEPIISLKREYTICWYISCVVAETCTASLIPLKLQPS